MRDLGPGCEGVDVALERWINAISVGDADQLYELLADDFQLTCDPSIAGGRMNKEEFIEFDRHIQAAKIEIVSLTARRMKHIAITQVFATVEESFSGDPAGTTADQLGGLVGSGRTLAYATGWRAEPDGSWRCFQHHLFGPVD